MAYGSGGRGEAADRPRRDGGGNKGAGGDGAAYVLRTCCVRAVCVLRARFI